MPMFGRETQVVDCRQGKGQCRGGGLAQEGTLSEAARPDVIAVAMGPGRRHITKPVCELTYGMRQTGIQVSVLVLSGGTGQPESGLISGSFGIEPEETEQIARHKLAVIHVGNVAQHIIKKIRTILENVDIPAIVVSQALIDFEDLAEAGIKTRYVKPKDENTLTKGTVMEIVTGVTRGEACSRDKLNELVKDVKNTLKSIE